MATVFYIQNGKPIGPNGESLTKSEVQAIKNAQAEAKAALEQEQGAPVEDTSEAQAQENDQAKAQVTAEQQAAKEEADRKKAADAAAKTAGTRSPVTP